MATSIEAAELDPISLITPVAYNRKSSMAETAKSKIKSGTASTFSVDIEKRVLSKIAPYNADLRGYFSSQADLDKFLKSIIQRGVREYLSDVTDANLIKFYKYLGNNLIGALSSRILEKEGVKDSSRRDLWTKKILVPFNDCIANANNSQYDANHCLEALTSSLVPSAGISVVFELTRTNLSSTLPLNERNTFNIEQVNRYKTCMKTTKSSSSDVKKCALTSMKAGVLKVTDKSLTKIINDKSSSKVKAAAIKKLVWPTFESCSGKVGLNPNSKESYPDQFKGCIDNLVQATGAELVEDKITTTPSIAAVFSASEVNKLALDKSFQFKACAENQKKKGAEVNGMLDTSICETAITNDVTYKVVSQTLRNTAADSFKKNKTQANKVSNEAIKLLDQCWNKNQSSSAGEACLRKTIVALSGTIATIKLDEAIPDNTPGKAKLTKSSVADLTQCIDKVLPKNISESSNLTNKIDGCIDNMIQSTGSNLVTNKILNTPAIAAAFSTSELNKLAAEQSAKFKACAENQKKKNATKDGILDTSPCEDAVTNEVTYKVVVQTFKKTADDSFQKNKTQASKVANEGIKLLDKCWSNNQTPSSREACLRKSIVAFSGVVATIKLDEAIPDNTPGKANINKTSVATLTQCIEKVLPKNISESNEISNKLDGCIDNMIKATGSSLVINKISNNDSVTNALSPAEVKKLALEKSAQFEKCAEVQKKKGASKNGILDLTPCEDAITNDVIYKVVSETLRKTASDSFKNDKLKASQVGNAGIKLLDKCWSSNQSSASREACLRKTIVSFSESVATVKLNDAIPSNMPTKSDLNKSSVAALTQCIEKELPKNISESRDLSSKIDSCTGKLTKNVALKVAEFQIRDTAGANLNSLETDTLVRSLVLDDFSKCIGQEPSDSKLDQCSGTLTTKAAKHISGVSFTKEVNGYLQKVGGLQSLGINQAQVDNFLRDLNNTNAACIDKKSSSLVMDQVNSCIKDSVKKIAFFFGDLQLNKSIGNMYNGREADKRLVEAQFRKSLDDCLNNKQGKEYSISDFTNNLYTCSDNVSNSISLAVGKDQVDTSLNQYLKDRPGIDLKDKRDVIGNELLSNFKNCMSSSTKQNICIDKLKRTATQSIVINYGRVEAKIQMNAETTPAELKPVEDNFMACTNTPSEGEALASKLDDCTKRFALDFAKELGTLKLNYLLKQALGTDGYLTQKNEINGILNVYYDCLNNLNSIKMSDGLTEKLGLCTNGLTNRGTNLVRSNINSWMTTEQKDSATIRIKNEFSNFLPCLSNLLPSSPYSPQLQQNIESNIKPLVHLLGQYIDYNPDNAKQTLNGIIQKLSIDLNDVSATKKAKNELLDFLYESGGLDQFLKAIVRGTVKDSLAGISQKDVPQDLRDILLRKENFEQIFNTPEGEKIKLMVMDKLLRPALIDGADMKGLAFKGSMDKIKEDVVKLLVNAPSFGEQAIKYSIQGQMNDMPGITKFFAKALYSVDSLEWDKLRLTPKGIEAENYIKKMVLTPKFTGVVQTPAEIKNASDEAERLIKIAVKNYRK